MTAPFAIGYWNGNRFVIPGLPQMAAAPTLPATTQQDVEAHQGATGLAPSQGPGVVGGGQGAPGMERNAGFADPLKDGGVMGPASGFNSNFGLVGGTLGMIGGGLAGVPGVGTALGTIGENIDLGRYAGSARANGITMSPNYGQATLAGLTSLPFGLGNILGTSARQQFEDARRNALADGVFGNTTAPAAGKSYGDAGLTNADLGWGLADRARADMFAAGFGDSGNDVSGSSSGDGTKGGDSKDSGAWGGGTGETSGWYAKGGTVRPPQPGAADPPGPDDQIAAVQSGEGILTRKAMKRHPGLLDALNRGDIKKARGLLG